MPRRRFGSFNPAVSGAVSFSQRANRNQGALAVALKWLGAVAGVGTILYNEQKYTPPIRQRDAMTERQRLLQVTKGNLQNDTLCITGHFDFFPKAAFGSPRRNGNGHAGIEIALDGLNETVLTDIGRDAKSGKPRRFLRGRGWVRKFYSSSGLRSITPAS